MGIMAGIGTVLADDPMLNVRVEGWKSPVRIVCDSKLRIPPGSQIVKSAEKYRTIVAYAEQKNAEVTENKNSYIPWELKPFTVPTKRIR